MGRPAWDPETGLFYVNSNEMAWVLRLVPRPCIQRRRTGSTLYVQNCAGCHRADLKGRPPEFPSLEEVGSTRTRDQVTDVIRKGAGRMPGFAQIGDDAVNAIVRLITTGEDLPVSGAEHLQPRCPLPEVRHRWIQQVPGSRRLPAVAPPWGTLNAINLNTDEYAWKIPFGEIPRPCRRASKHRVGKLRRSHRHRRRTAVHRGDEPRSPISGYENSEAKFSGKPSLPAAGNATPAVYEVKGKQYVVIAAGGGNRASQAAAVMSRSRFQTRHNAGERHNCHSGRACRTFVHRTVGPVQHRNSSGLREIDTAEHHRRTAIDDRGRYRRIQLDMKRTVVRLELSRLHIGIGFADHRNGRWQVFRFLAESNM